ncbi:MAG TPA: hypothetical protein VGC79_14910 [Polyangiaceae bacterium]
MPRIGLAVAIAAVVGCAFAKHAAAADPIWSQLTQLESGGSNYGRALSISGDTIVVGDSPTLRAKLWVRTGTSTWSQREPLTVPYPAYGFGTSVSISNDTVVVGVPGGTSQTVGPGAAFVFVRDANVWPLQQDALTAQGGPEQDLFGTSVALSGDTAVIGAPGTTVSGHVGQGAAYVFGRSAGVWEKQGSALVAPEGEASDAFGSAVAIFDDTIVIGAPGSAPGRAYVFSRTGTTWAQQGAALGPPDASSPANFGAAVSAAADTVLIGADGANVQPGKAYLFSRNGSDWTTNRVVLESTDPFTQDHFGNAVALRGEVALISSPGGPEHSAAYVFTRVGSAWLQQGPRFFLNGSHNRFRGGVALSDDVAVVGAIAPLLQLPYSTTIPAASGTAYVFAPSAQASYCAHDSDCSEQLYCAEIGVCEPRLPPAWKCDQCLEPDCRACAASSCMDGQCQRKDNGVSCRDISECASLVCRDGVCCEDECQGNCQSCAEPGAEGRCVTIQGQPRGDHGVCTDGKGCFGYCDGQNIRCNNSACMSGGADGGAAGAGAAGGDDSSLAGESSSLAGGGSAGIGSAGTCADSTECDPAEPSPSSESSAACGCHLARRGSSQIALIFTLLGFGAAMQRRRSRKHA